jgi:DNA-binding transcriptional ArsR family regulator
MNMRSNIHKIETCEVACIHPEAVEAAKKSAISRGAAEELSGIFQVMSDPTRLRILSLLLKKELCVCDLSSALDMTQSAVSHQLRVMRLNRLVKYRREGRIAFYSLDDEHVKKLYTQGLKHLTHGSNAD